jgi:hypothetical protein
METLNRTIAKIIPQNVFSYCLNKYELFIKEFLETPRAKNYIERFGRFPVLMVFKNVKDEFGISLYEAKDISESYQDKFFKNNY